MNRTSDLRKGAHGSDSLPGGGSELEKRVSRTTGSVPSSAALEESMVLEMQPSEPASEQEDAALSRCQATTWSPDPEIMISFAGPEHSRPAEEFRSLRSRLYRLRQERPIKSLLVTSALPREGRSFVAANLANVMALQPNCRVLLIDADLRSPQLHSTLGTSLTPGLSDYLLQDVEPFRVVQKGTAEGLFFIPAGRAVSGPTELLGTDRLNSLIDSYGAVFDWIIIDSPATTPVSDASLIANCCDGVLLVVRSHSTPFDLVQKARRKFREERLLGVVLNQSAGT